MQKKKKLVCPPCRPTPFLFSCIQMPLLTAHDKGPHLEFLYNLEQLHHSPFRHSQPQAQNSVVERTSGLTRMSSRPKLKPCSCKKEVNSRPRALSRRLQTSPLYSYRQEIDNHQHWLPHICMVKGTTHEKC